MARWLKTELHFWDWNNDGTNYPRTLKDTRIRKSCFQRSSGCSCAYLLQWHQQQCWTGAGQGRSLTYHTQSRWGADPSASIRKPLPHHLTPHLHCTLSSRSPPPRSQHLVCERHFNTSFQFIKSLLHRSHSFFLHQAFAFPAKINDHQQWTRIENSGRR